MMDDKPLKKLLESLLKHMGDMASDVAQLKSMMLDLKLLAECSGAQELILLLAPHLFSPLSHFLKCQFIQRSHLPSSDD